MGIWVNKDLVEVVLPGIGWFCGRKMLWVLGLRVGTIGGIWAIFVNEIRVRDCLG